jgi:hypothetical protein
MEERRVRRTKNIVDGEACRKAIDAWRYWWWNRTGLKPKKREEKEE